MTLISYCLDSIWAGFTGTDTYGLLNFGDKYFAIAYFSSFSGIDDRLYNVINLLIVNGNLNLDLGQEVHLVLRATIQLRDPSVDRSL